MTKVIAFNGSPRSEGNTSILIKQVFSVLIENGIETELIQIGNKTVHGCTACGKCREFQDKKLSPTTTRLLSSTRQPRT